MKITEKIMGHEMTIEVLDDIQPDDMDRTFEYFHGIEKLFNAKKKDSELSKINRDILKLENVTPIVRKIIKLCEQTRINSHGYFNAKYENHFDPAGLLKGYAITEAANLFEKKGYRNFYIAIGTDFEIKGLKNGQKWKVGLQNLMTSSKTHVISLSNKGMATSGLSHVGLPIYNPLTKKAANALVSVTVIAKNAYEADRFSTTAFAMGDRAYDFLTQQEDVDAIIIERNGQVFLTDGMSNYM